MAPLEARKKPTSIVTDPHLKSNTEMKPDQPQTEAPHKPCPTFLVAETLTKFSQELDQITSNEDPNYVFQDTSSNRVSSLSDYLSSGYNYKWGAQGCNLHVLALRAHYIRDPVAIRTLARIEEKVRLSEADPTVDRDEIPQPRWRLRDRVPQVGRSWRVARALRAEKAADEALWYSLYSEKEFYR